MNCSCLNCGNLVNWSPSLLCKECKGEEEDYAEENYYSWDREIGTGWTADFPRLDKDECSE